MYHGFYRFMLSNSILFLVVLKASNNKITFYFYLKLSSLSFSSILLFFKISPSIFRFTSSIKFFFYLFAWYVCCRLHVLIIILETDKNKTNWAKRKKNWRKSQRVVCIIQRWDASTADTKVCEIVREWNKNFLLLRKTNGKISASRK